MKPVYNGYDEQFLNGKQVKEFFDKYLDCVIKEPSNKVKERKKKEFEELLKGE